MQKQHSKRTIRNIRIGFWNITALLTVGLQHIQELFASTQIVAYSGHLNGAKWSQNNTVGVEVGVKVEIDVYFYAHSNTRTITIQHYIVDFESRIGIMGAG